MKNNIKKLLTVLIVVLSMTALAACSSDEPDEGFIIGLDAKAYVLLSLSLIMRLVKMTLPVPI